MNIVCVVVHTCILRTQRKGRENQIFQAKLHSKNPVSKQKEKAK